MRNVAMWGSRRQGNFMGHSRNKPRTGNVSVSPLNRDNLLPAEWASPPKQQVWLGVQGDLPTQRLYVVQDRRVGGEHTGYAWLHAPDVSQGCGCLTRWPGDWTQKKLFVLLLTANLPLREELKPWQKMVCVAVSSKPLTAARIRN